MENERNNLILNIGDLVEDTYVDEYDKEKYIRVYENMILVKGGDGTLLKAIKLYRHLKKPFFGIAGGTLGFLMNTNLPHTYFPENIVTQDFSLIKVKVTYTVQVPDPKTANIYDKDITVTKEYQAFNDISLGGDMNSYIEFNILEEDNFFGSFKGGGVIVSTAQGSTGINKNNRGAILSLNSKLWSVTGDKTERDIKAVIEPHKLVINVKSRTHVSLWVDGSNEIIRNVSKVEITKGDNVELIFGDYPEFQKKRSL